MKVFLIVILFCQSAIEPVSDNDFARRLFAEEPGHVTVTVTLTPATGSNLQLPRHAIQLSDEIQIQVGVVILTVYFLQCYLLPMEISLVCSVYCAMYTALKLSLFISVIAFKELG